MLLGAEMDIPLWVAWLVLGALTSVALLAGAVGLLVYWLTRRRSQDPPDT